MKICLVFVFFVIVLLFISGCVSFSKDSSSKITQPEIGQDPQGKVIIRELAKPIDDSSTFSMIVQSVIADNPLGCVGYTEDGKNHDPVEKIKVFYIARILYEDKNTNVIKTVEETYDSSTAYKSGIPSLLANAQIANTQGSVIIHDPKFDIFGATLRCHDVNGEIYNLVITRDEVVLAAYSNDSIRTMFETWASTVPELRQVKKNLEENPNGNDERTPYVNMDLGQFLSLIINFLVAAGTILLAIFAYKNIIITQSQLKYTESQLKSFQEQTKLLLSQNQPILRFETFSFSRNTLYISLTNLGTQLASDIGFSTICIRVDKVQDIKEMESLYNFGWPGVSEEYIKDFFVESPNQKILISEYVDEGDILKGQKRVPIQPIPGITYLKRENGEVVLSHEDRPVVFKGEPFFYFDSDFENAKDVFLMRKDPEALKGYKYKRYNFEDIAEILRYNKVRYVYLSFSLFCKDLIENEMFQDDIASCIVDLNEDKSIEEALLKPRALKRYPISHLKLVREIGSEPKWMYENSKWKMHLLTETEKEKLSGPRAEFPFSLRK